MAQQTEKAQKKTKSTNMKLEELMEMKNKFLLQTDQDLTNVIETDGGVKNAAELNTLSLKLKCGWFGVLQPATTIKQKKLVADMFEKSNGRPFLSENCLKLLKKDFDKQNEGKLENKVTQMKQLKEKYAKEAKEKAEKEAKEKYEGQIADHVAKHRDQVAKIAELESSLLGANDRVKKVNTDKVEWEGKIDQYKDKVEGLELELGNANNTIDTLRSDLAVAKANAGDEGRDKLTDKCRDYLRKLNVYEKYSYNKAPSTIPSVTSDESLSAAEDDEHELPKSPKRRKVEQSVPEVTVNQADANVDKRSDAKLVELETKIGNLTACLKGAVEDQAAYAAMVAISMVSPGDVHSLSRAFKLAEAGFNGMKESKIEDVNSLNDLQTAIHNGDQAKLTRHEAYVAIQPLLSKRMLGVFKVLLDNDEGESSPDFKMFEDDLMKSPASSVGSAATTTTTSTATSSTTATSDQLEVIETEEEKRKRLEKENFDFLLNEFKLPTM